MLLQPLVDLPSNSSTQPSFFSWSDNSLSAARRGEKPIARSARTLTIPRSQAPLGNERLEALLPEELEAELRDLCPQAELGNKLTLIVFMLVVSIPFGIRYVCTD